MDNTKDRKLFKIINIYGDIDETLTQQLSSYFNLINPKEAYPIFCNINSMGGDPREIDKILQMKNVYPGKVIGFVSGQAQSAAFVFLQLCCDLRLGLQGATLCHKEMERKTKFDISPLTSNTAAHKFIDTHIEEIKVAQMDVEVRIAKRTGISLDTIVFMKGNGVLSGLKAEESGLLDKATDNIVEALAYTEDWLAKQK